MTLIQMWIQEFFKENFGILAMSVQCSSIWSYTWSNGLNRVVGLRSAIQAEDMFEIIIDDLDISWKFFLSQLKTSA